jgi:hypothetical protein
VNISLRANQTTTAIRAELDGTNRCYGPAAGLYVCAETPILEMRRQLVKAGYWPGLRLDCYRGATLALTGAASVRAQRTARGAYEPAGASKKRRRLAPPSIKSRISASRPFAIKVAVAADDHIAVSAGWPTTARKGGFTFLTTNGEEDL